MITFAALVPHPPESIPGIGQQKEIDALKKTMLSFEKLRIALEHSAPDTIIIISPHAPLEPYSFVVNSDSLLKGSFMEFGLDRDMTFKNDIEIVENISFSTLTNEIESHLHANFLDHGALIPLFHFTKNIKPNLVHLSFSLLGMEQHFHYGELLGKIFSNTPKRIAIIASGDLSHRLLPSSPAGYSPRAKFFDQRIIEYLHSSDLALIKGLHQEYIEEAAECGLRSFLIAMGAVHSQNYKFELLSYEYPFGVGYVAARLI